MCDLKPEGCMVAHIAPVLHARRTGDEDKEQWSAPCPSCDGHSTSLSLSSKTRTQGRRNVWNCHSPAHCSEELVHAAMLARGIARACIPLRKPSAKPEPSRDVAGEIEQIILNDASNPQRMRLLIGMAIWDCGREEARQKLGISRATAYRAVSPVRQNPRS